MQSSNQPTSYKSGLPRSMWRLARLGLLIGLLSFVLVACGRPDVDESQLPTPVPTIAPFVTEIPIPPTRTPTTEPTPVPTVALLPTPTAEATAEATADATADATAESAEDADTDAAVSESAQTEDAGAEATDTEATVTEATVTEATDTEATDIEAADSDSADTEADSPEAEGEDSSATEAETTETEATASETAEAADAESEDTGADETEAEDDPAAEAAATPDSGETVDPEADSETDTEATDTEATDTEADTDTGDEATPGTEAEDAEAEAVAPDATDTDATITDDADADATDADASDVVATAEPSLQFRQPTSNAVVPLTFTVNIQAEGITLLPAHAATSEEDPEAAESTVEEADAEADSEDADTEDADTEDADTEDADTEDADTEDADAEDADTEDADTESDNAAAHLFVLVNVPALEIGATVPVTEPFVVPVDADGSAQLALSAGTYELGLQLADEELNALETNDAPIVVIARAGAADQAVRIAMPTDAATVPPEFQVVMAATGLTVTPITAPITATAPEQSGHFHLLIDEDFVPTGEIIPADDTHVHFGAGQLTTTLSLEPGVHTLRLQMANAQHVAMDGAQYRDAITVTVEPDAPSPQAMFVEPADGATVPPTFPVRWAAAGLLVEPVGAVLGEGRGHFHVLIDTDFVPAGEVILTDDAHRHFGGGQLATELTLEPGDYTLRLQMANGAHIALEGEAYHAEISVTVAEATEEAPGVDDSAENGEATDEAGDAEDSAEDSTEDSTETGVAEPTDAENDKAEDLAEDE